MVQSSGFKVQRFTVQGSQKFRGLPFRVKRIRVLGSKAQSSKVQSLSNMAPKKEKANHAKDVI
jgi:hypothetical protein